MVIDGKKYCSHCKQMKSLEFFTKQKAGSKQRGDGYCYWCRKCSSAKGLAWAKANRDKVNAYLREWTFKNKDKIKIKDRKRYLKHREYWLRKERQRRADLRLEVFKEYGGKCKCCGESKVEFLCIDHITGGGREEKRKNGKSIHYRLKLEGFPKDKYQLLCHNCNMSLGFFGYCPHRPEIKRPVFTGRPMQPS